MAVGGRNVDGPVAGAAHIRLTAFLERLEGALAAFVMDLAVGRAHQLTEFIVEALLTEIVLLLRHSFLQAEMRFNQEFRHGFLQCSLSSVKSGTPFSELQRSEIISDHIQNASKHSIIKPSTGKVAD